MITSKENKVCRSYSATFLKKMPNVFDWRGSARIKEQTP